MKQAYRYLDKMSSEELDGLAALIAAPNKLIKTITLKGKKVQINLTELSKKEMKERYC